MSACPCWRPEDGGQCSTCGEILYRRESTPLNINVSIKDYHGVDIAEALRNGGYAEYAEQIEAAIFERKAPARSDDDGGAAELRQAAEALRSLASGATAVPWVRNGVNGIHTRRGTCIATTEQRIGDARRFDADYIATMHPGVGLAVADLIQREHDEHAGDDMGDTGDGPLCLTWPVILDLARLINNHQHAE